MTGALGTPKKLKLQIYKENQLNRNFCLLFFNGLGVKFVTLRPNLKKRR
jgi:hypothetical protein